MKRLKLEQNSMSTQALIVEIRKLILANNNDEFDSDNIILWPNLKIEKE